MQAERIDFKNNTRIALLEQSISYSQQSLDRMEKRFDTLDKKIDRIESKMESSFRWIMTTSMGAFFSLAGLGFTIYQIFKG